MRETCRDCARKHIAQALVLATEQRLGYPSFNWLVVGHLAEAEAELVVEHQDLANEIREYRNEYMADPSINLPLMELLDKITKLDETTKEQVESKGRSKKERS